MGRTDVIEVPFPVSEIFAHEFEYGDLKVKSLLEEAAAFAADNDFGHFLIRKILFCEPSIGYRNRVDHFCIKISISNPETGKFGSLEIETSDDHDSGLHYVDNATFEVYHEDVEVLTDF